MDDLMIKTVETYKRKEGWKWHKVFMEMISQFNRKEYERKTKLIHVLLDPFVFNTIG